MKLHIYLLKKECLPWSTLAVREPQTVSLSSAKEVAFLGLYFWHLKQAFCKKKLPSFWSSFGRVQNNEESSAAFVAALLSRSPADQNCEQVWSWKVCAFSFPGIQLVFFVMFFFVKRLPQILCFLFWGKYFTKHPGSKVVQINFLIKKH